MVSELDTNWFLSFYGYQSTVDFAMINAISNGPYNYNVDLESLDGRKTTYAIIGASIVDSLGIPMYGQNYMNVLIHEFNHSFANPVIYENETGFKAAGKNLYKQCSKSKIATNEAYGNWQTMLCEYLVRAAVIKYLIDHDYDPEIIENQIENERKRGFQRVKELVEKLANYSSNRDKFKDMNDFTPELISFFESID